MRRRRRSAPTTTGDRAMIRHATEGDISSLHSLIREFAHYEQLDHQATGTQADLCEHLFGRRRFAEALIAEADGAAIGFVFFFHNFSIFFTKSGTYLEDLFVREEQSREGIGRDILAAIAKLAVERGCGRF
jgi:GNAT superfamily N-acetyltransferase